MIEAALEYASRGWAVFPVHSAIKGRCTCGKPECGAPGKHPLFSGGFKIATTDPETISGWWGDGQAYNIAIATGQISGIFVLDVDVSGEKGGLESLQELEAAHGPLDKSCAVRTGSGGWHFYFEMPAENLGSSAGKLGPGLDIRANGGYVLAPPSHHISGNTYQWETFE